MFFGAEILQASAGTVNLKQVFAASPIIYSILGVMSIGSLVIWAYTLLTFRVKEVTSAQMVNELTKLLATENYEKAIEFCQKKENLLAHMVASGIVARKYGPQYMVETMRSEGKRATAELWQRISLLSDFVLVAPMLGLLGTVLGMFYAFYDVNRSKENIMTIFDGLGISVGCTVAGLIVAILSMMFHATLKYRVSKMLNAVETEALTLGNLIRTDRSL